MVCQGSVRSHVAESYMWTFPEIPSGFTRPLKRRFYYCGDLNLQKLLITISSLMNPVRIIVLTFLKHPFLCYPPIYL